MKNQQKQMWETKYMPNFRICQVINDMAYDLQDPSVHDQHAAVAHIQLLMLSKYIVSLLPDTRVFRRACKDINDPSLMPDVNWLDPGQKHTACIIYGKGRLLIRNNLPWLKLIHLNLLGGLHSSNSFL